MFKLDKQLEKDCFFVANLSICKVLLMNNKNFTWLVLVPQIQDAVELVDLPFATQTQILSEINLVTKILQKKFLPHKINTAMLGNMVRQLHIHIILRFENDIAFPKPVWGLDSIAYNADEAQKIINEIKTELLK